MAKAWNPIPRFWGLIKSICFSILNKELNCKKTARHVGEGLKSDAKGSGLTNLTTQPHLTLHQWSINKHINRHENIVWTGEDIYYINTLWYTCLRLYHISYDYVHAHAFFLTASYQYCTRNEEIIQKLTGTKDLEI